MFTQDSHVEPWSNAWTSSGVSKSLTRLHLVRRCMAIFASKSLPLSSSQDANSREAYRQHFTTGRAFRGQSFPGCRVEMVQDVSTFADSKLSHCHSFSHLFCTQSFLCSASLSFISSRIRLDSHLVVITSFSLKYSHSYIFLKSSLQLCYAALQAFTLSLACCNLL